MLSKRRWTKSRGAASPSSSEGKRRRFETGPEAALCKRCLGWVLVDGPEGELPGESDMLMVISIFVVPRE